MLRGVERDHAKGIVILAGDEIGDDGFEIGSPDLGFTKHAAMTAEIVDHEIDGLVGPVRNHRRHPVRGAHHPAFRVRPPAGFSVFLAASFAASLGACLGASFGASLAASFAAFLPLIGSSISRWPSARFGAFLAFAAGAGAGLALL